MNIGHMPHRERHSRLCGGSKFCKKISGGNGDLHSDRRIWKESGISESAEEKKIKGDNLYHLIKNCFDSQKIGGISK